MLKAAVLVLPLFLAGCNDAAATAAAKPAPKPQAAKALPADASAVLPPGHPPIEGAAAAPLAAQAAEEADAKVEKAEGKDARTVAEVWAEKAALSGKEVVVRGRVFKFNAEIMGRNWIHLRDGSGSAEKGDNDITVTTADVAKKGDVVTIRGKVGVDRDFTSGYTYPVIIEEAKIVK